MHKDVSILHKRKAEALKALSYVELFQIFTVLPFAIEILFYADGRQIPITAALSLICWWFGYLPALMYYRGLLHKTETLIRAHEDTEL